MQLPAEDRYSLDKNRILDTITVLFGGRIAEEIFMHQMTTGASNDFERATDMARKMVTQWECRTRSESWCIGENEGRYFWGARSPHTRIFPKSDHAASGRRDSPHHRPAVCTVTRLIEENRDKIEAMAKALLEWGNPLMPDQINDIMAGDPPTSHPSQAKALRQRNRPQKSNPDGSGHYTYATCRRNTLKAGKGEGGRDKGARCACHGYYPSPSPLPLHMLHCGHFQLDLSRTLVMWASFKRNTRFILRRRAAYAARCCRRSLRNNYIAEGCGYNRHRRRIHPPRPHNRFGIQQELDRSAADHRKLARVAPVPISIDTCKRK